MKRKVALFDFDNTICEGDSINRFIKYDLKHKPWHILYFIPFIFYGIGYVCHIISFERCKSALLFPLKSMSEDDLKKFYLDIIPVHYYPQVVEVLNKHHNDDYYIIVCTASIESYMKYCELPIDAMIGTRIENNLVVGKNCKNEEKVNRILNHLKEKDIEIDYDESYGYSDSNHDIPMLSLVKNKKRIQLKTGNIFPFEEA